MKPKKDRRMSRAAAVLLFLTVSLTACQPDEPTRTFGDSPTPALSANGTVPRLTMAEYQTLVQDQNDEAKLYQKLSLITYALTEFIGGHTGLGNDNSALAGVFPCNDGFLDNTGGIYRFLSDQSGMPITQVHSTLGGYIAARITNFPASSGETYPTVFLSLVSSLRIEGGQLDFVARRPDVISANNNSEIFIAYGAYSTAQGAPVVAGYKWHRQNGLVSQDDKRSFASAAGVNMILFEPVEVGVARMNDPCYYLHNPPGGGGGSGGSGGGGTTYDDDGAVEKSYDGPSIVPPVGCDCIGFTKQGIRVNRFHLSDRNEGGFGGKSEVYWHTTVYRSTDPTGSRLLDNHPDIETFPCTDAAPFGWNISKGRHIINVADADIDDATNTIINVPAGKQVLIPKGFCPYAFLGPDQSTFDRLYFTVFERDGLWGRTVNFQELDLPRSVVGDCPTHYQTAQFERDMWFTNEGFRITYNDFAAHGDKIYLVELPGSYEMRFTMPGADKSWFELELF